MVKPKKNLPLEGYGLWIFSGIILFDRSSNKIVDCINTIVNHKVEK